MPCSASEARKSQAWTLRYGKVLFILDQTDRAKMFAGCLAVGDRSPVVEIKRLDDMLSIVVELQTGCE